MARLNIHFDSTLLNGVPRTTRDALERIAEHGRRAHFARHGLRDGTKRCPIGIFFTDAQIDHIASLNGAISDCLANDPVIYIPDAIGEDNFVAMTGLLPDQAAAIQFCYDEQGQRRFLGIVRDVLAGRSSRIEWCEEFRDLDVPNPHYQTA